MGGCYWLGVSELFEKGKGRSRLASGMSMALVAAHMRICRLTFWRLDCSASFCLQSPHGEMGLVVSCSFPFCVVAAMMSMCETVVLGCRAWMVARSAVSAHVEQG